MSRGRGLLVVAVAAAWLTAVGLQAAGLQLPADPRLRRAVVASVVTRVAAAVSIGAALGAAGLLLQTVTENPLADPEVTGANHGAAFGAVLTGWLVGASGVGFLPGALVGALVAAGIVMALGFAPGAFGTSSQHRLILLGIAMSALLSSWTATVLVFSEASLTTVLAWLAGSLAGTRPGEVGMVSVAVVLVGAAACLCHRHLDVLGAGAQTARSLGSPVTRVRAWALIGAVVLVASAVAAAGPVGFVGLLAATVARRTVGAHHLQALPLSALTGATVLMLADAVGQRILPPAEIPVGVFTALLGAPLMLWRVRKEVPAA